MLFSQDYKLVKMGNSFEYIKPKNSFLHFPAHFKKFGFNKSSLYQRRILGPFIFRSNKGPLHKAKNIFNDAKQDFVTARITSNAL